MRDDGRVPLTLVTGPANSAKARAVLDGVRASLDRDPVLVVPTRDDVDRYRRELAEDGLVLGARVVTFQGLLEEAAARAGVTARPLGALARERVAAAVVARASLTALAASAATPGFPRAAVRLFSELEVARVDPGRLAGGLRAWAAGDPGRAAYGEEVARLYGAYRGALERLGRPDADLWALSALDALRLAPAAWGAAPAFFYGFDDLTPLQLDAVEALAKGVDADVWVSLTFEPGRAAFAGRAATAATLAPLADRRLEMAPEDRYYAPAARAALHALERRLFEAGGEPPVPAGGAVALLEAGGERAEAELVAAEVRSLLGAGVPAEEIAVVARSLDESGPLLERVLADFGVPVSLRRRAAFGHTAIGRGVLALLRCALGEGAAGDVVAWLRAPGVLRGPGAADALERRTRRSGAATAEDALRLWGERHERPVALDRLRRAADAGAAPLCEALAEELSRMLGRALGGGAAPAGGDAAAGTPGAAAAGDAAAGTPGAIAAGDAAAGAPPAVPVPAPPLLDAGARDEARAVAAARAALAELAALAREAPALAPTPAELAAHLAGVEVRTGEPPGPGRVTVCDPLALRARRVRALVLCGLQEGAFPRPSTPDPFFSDAQRRDLARASGIVLPRHEDALGAERYLFYAAVSRPEQRLVLSTRTADDDGDPAVPSFFLDDVRDVLTELERTHRPLGAIAWPGAPPTSRAAARAAAAQAPPRRPAPIPPLGADPVLRDLRERPAWSPSALERWAACPVRWFVERYLHADDLEPDPEPLVRGKLAHAALERTLAGLREETGSAKVRPDTLDRARELLRAALEALARELPISPSPERVAAGTRRLEADLERYLTAAAHDGSAFEPRHLELSFGFQDAEDASLPPLELQAPDGPLRLRGRIDRVDVDSSGRRAQVIDYKTGEAVPGARWEQRGSFQAALYLRAAADLLGLDPAGAFYQPLSAPDARRRGLIEADADPALDVVGIDRRPADEVAAILDAIVGLATTAAAQARAGALEPRPETCSTRGCAYPGICRCEAA